MGLLLLLFASGILLVTALNQIDFLGVGLDFLRNRRFQREWDEFEREKIDPLNQALLTNAGALGPVGNTTEMAGQSYQRALGLAGGLSDQYRQDVLAQGAANRATAEATLRNRGITGSTVLPGVLAGVERGTMAELARANDQRLANLLGVEDTFGGARIAASQFAQQAGADALVNQTLIAPQEPPQTRLYGRRYGGQ